MLIRMPRASLAARKDRLRSFGSLRAHRLDCLTAPRRPPRRRSSCPRAGCGRSARGRPRSACGRRPGGRGSGSRPGGARAGRPDEAIELAPGDGHRHVLRVAGRVEDVGAHRPVGAVVAARRRSSRGRARGRPTGGSARGARRRWRASPRAPRRLRRASEISGRGSTAPTCAFARRARARAAPRQSPAGRCAVTEARPAEAPHFQRRPSRRASCRRRAGARPALRRSCLVQRRAPGSPRSARPRAGSGGAAPKPGMSSAMHLALAARAARSPGPRRCASRRARGSAAAARGRRAACRRSPRARLGEEHLHVADPPLAETRLRGAEVEVPEAPEALVVAARAQPLPGAEEALAPGGQGRRVVGGDVVDPDLRACWSPGRRSRRSSASRAGSRRGRRGCWRSSATPFSTS